MDPVKKSYLQLHIAVFLFGFTAILGKLIQLSEISLVWWRLLITCISLVLLPGILRDLRQLSFRKVLALSGIGVIVAMHWVTFYGAIKYSNVSVALSCLATASFFTSIIEPLLLRQPFKWYELLLGLMVIPGMYMIFRFSGGDYLTGIIMGLLSALLAATFAVLNKQMVADTKPMTMTFVELGAGFVFLTPILPFYWSWLGNSTFWPTLMDWQYLILLSLLCTTLAYVLSLQALKHLSAFTSTLTINLEPVYGILMAWFFFQEHKEMNPAFYMGAAIIILAVFIHPVLRRKMEK